MKLFLKNIGKIGEADIEINGITVIAGENNVGKSTVGKALFTIFNCFKNVENKVFNEKIKSINHVLNRDFHYICSFLNNKYDRDYDESLMKICRLIVDEFNYSDENKSITKEDICKIIVTNIQFEYQKHREIFNKMYGIGRLEEVISESFSKIKNILELDDNMLICGILQESINTEFNNQPCNVFLESNGELLLTIGERNIYIKINEDGKVEDIKMKNFYVNADIVYLDDPFVMDDYAASRRIRNHRNNLVKKLLIEDNEINVADKIVMENKLKDVYDKINDICGGSLVDGNRHSYAKINKGEGYFNIFYKDPANGRSLNMKNLSAGLKSFVILKTLLMNGSIDYNSVLVLDEPEIHLHPEWQLIFAEIIVLLQKEFDLHILLNTHSPYFLNALEIYAAKHDIGDKCKYYLAETEDNIAHIKDVTDNIEAIYYKLARPLQKLEDEKGDL